MSNSFKSILPVCLLLFSMMLSPLFLHAEMPDTHPAPAMQQEVSLTGTVCDAYTKEPLAGVTVYVEGTLDGTSSDADGRFKLTVSAKGCTVVFSLLGYAEKKVVFDGKQKDMFKQVEMKEDSEVLDDVVVTGVYSRKKESFTGVSASFRADELKSIGTQNALTSLKTLDPSFKISDNMQFGSDPNRMPDFEIRGKSSIAGLKEEFGTDPNQPLFILDGFETTLETIMNLNMNRVSSVTILKDAASTAIYGSKASNGVVVIETKTPSNGRLSLSYKGDYSLTAADLSDYNLMNSSEKLQFETLAGVYTAADGSASSQLRLDDLRNSRLKSIAEGVDTYWLCEPLRSGYTQKHNLYAEGGEEHIRYGIGLSYGDVQGVMKGSDRQNVGGNIDLIYRTGKFQFSNKFSLDSQTTSDPSVSFETFALASPYYKKYNDEGQVEKYLYYYEDPLTGEVEMVSNPLWNAHLNNYDRSRQTSYNNKFILEWFLTDDFRLRGKFGIDHYDETREERLSPLHTDFDNSPDTEKGSYSHTLYQGTSYEGDVTATYGHVFDGRHTVNAVGGFNFSSSSSSVNGYSTTGFSDDQFGAPSFSNSYPTGGKSVYSESLRRAASFYFNGGYSYDSRYLLDLNYRADGASMFGTNNRFRNTWAAGLGWNIHNEPFLKDRGSFQMLKLRASVGNPGNQNFSAYQAFSTYKFNSWMTNVFGPGVILNQLGNPDLAWQETVNYDLGTDVTCWNNRLSLVYDFYVKVTDPLLALITTPGSMGVNSVYMNAGEQHTSGMEATLKISPVYRPRERVIWNISLSGSHIRSRYANIGDAFASLNKDGQNSLAGTTRYYDGGSPTAIWGVRSAGIDPATGQELFIKKDGTYSFNYDIADEVVLGDTEPLIEGVIGSTFFYKGFSIGAYIRYSYGAQIFNTSLFNKVENISTAAIYFNQDKRALYDRWSPDHREAYFKGISLTQKTDKSSRFVMDENYITGESFSLSYEFDGRKIQALGLNAVTLQASMNDIFRLSTVRQERGTSYPFARTASFSVMATF